MEERVWVRYRNYKNEEETRCIIPKRFYWGSTKWHPEPQYLLEVFDVDKQAERTFAMEGILKWARTEAEVSGERAMEFGYRVFTSL